MVVPLETRLLHHTAPFLARLLGCSSEEVKGRPLTFLAFDDEKPGGNRRPQLTKTFHGSLDDHGETLDRLNRAGAGIFVTVNQTDLKGRKKANIAALRAWWADLDEKNAREDFEPARVPLAPSMQVRSGHGTHLYWIPAAPIPCHEDETRRGAHEAELRAIAAALESFGADSDVCDVPRVMRLPGFYNRKRAPFPLVELVTADGPAATREQVQAAFPQHETVSEPGHGAAPVQVSCSGRPSNWRERVAAFVATCSSSVQGQKGADILFETCLKLYSRFGLLPEEVVEVVMSDYNVPGVCIPEWSLAEVQRKAADADKAAGPDRGTAWREDRPTVRNKSDTRGRDVAEPIPGSPKLVPAPGAPAEGKVSPATKALQVALAAGAEPWVDETRTPFITVPMGSHVEHYRLKADPESPAGRWLAGIYYRTFRKALGASVKRDVLENLIADAMASDRAFPTARRIFRKGDRVFLDLCTPTWEVVEVGAEGWKVCPAAAVPVRFTRAASMLPLPCPVRGGTVEALRPFFNCGEDDFRLVVAWALTALSGGREYPVLVFGASRGLPKARPPATPGTWWTQTRPRYGRRRRRNGTSSLQPRTPSSSPSTI